MFKQPVDERLSAWAEFRTSLNESETPFDDVWEYWKNAPFVPYNHRVDPYNQWGWPTPWEIIIDNHYDDFTRALMIGWSIKLTEKFKESRVELRTIVDKHKNSAYNVIFINDEIAINYLDNGPTSVKNLPESFFVENLIELKRPR